MYRWGPGNGARAPTAPAPSDLRKATGMLPHVKREEQKPACALGSVWTLLGQGRVPRARDKISEKFWGGFADMG